MNCEEFRFSVGAEPSTTRLDVLEHAAICAECARYRTELRAMDGLIHKALRIDVSAASQGAALTTLHESRTGMNWRVAATVLVSVVVMSLAWLAYPRQSLAHDVVEHVMSEAQRLGPTNQELDSQVVNTILGRAGVRLAENDLTVSYAMVCVLRGHEAPHLVVRTDAGPVTVLVLSHEKPISSPQRFEEQGFVGTLVPAPQGVIAVLGRDVPLDQVSREVSRALSYDAR